MARDIENIYLVHEAIEQNTQFNTSCSASTSALLPDSSYQPLSNYQQSPRTTNYNSNNRYTSSFHNKANYSPRFSFRPSSRQHHTPSFQSSTNRQFGSAANPRNITRQNLFNFQIPSSTQQLQPPLSTLNISPLMPPSSSVPPTQLSQPTSTAAAITCQWTEPVKDGPVSNNSYLQPSKPFLLYATLLINNLPLQTLIGIGASATCISFNVLQRMSNFRYIDTTVVSFVLDDGVISLQSNGSVEISMQFGNELIHFRAFVINKLCVDLIIGMDFLIIFNANIDVKSQHLSLEISGRRTSIRLDDHFRRPLIPLHARQSTFVPPHSTVAILASTPISSLSAYFIPTSNFIERPYLSSTQKLDTIHHHHSCLLVTN
ncbi:unnamed protein product [Rotaria socialis]|nr:unnamed protein product [Rotaria socialis]